jgi:uncharacterized protein (DUF2249 family)
MPEIPPLLLDVRPLTAQKRPPMPAILGAIAQLAPGQPLRLLAPFEPVPLYSFMQERGFSHAAQPLEGGAWEVIFRRADAS